ncbi:NADPH-dependent glutamate synthase [Thermospira aquatica]|uniref:NADPH-dependent glutamate synthase n=1 Tax=Thermospira aquatica TaxID=2828656 RepID=A0AAX3BGA5_9SPIR|nr:NADPH-dependent glutamate synthase [Thermospira aquatica]URA11387.1 NADPH-dependent glutamate synthase [Thermospira aquatica]
MSEQKKIQKQKIPVRQRTPEERVKDFGEVEYLYSPEEATLEALRCLQCKNPPCVEDCPVHIKIPVFIRQIAEKNIELAIRTILEDNPLPSVCGRVCPQESQCQKRCTVGRIGDPIQIGKLERFVGDSTLKPLPERMKKNKKVAVIGSGPASLTCAGELARLGYTVTVFEALHEIGGVLLYGIPEFRLPKAVLEQEISYLRELGVEFQTNVLVGRTLPFHELREQFDAVFLGTGAGLPKYLHIPGENLRDVYSANEFLTRINLMKSYMFGEYDTPLVVKGDVVVIGGGNVAMDAARSALRMGARSVTVVYRRGRKEMPARIEEIAHAEEEGVKFAFLAAPVRIEGDSEGNVTSIVCQRMLLGEPDERGRRCFLPVEGDYFVLPANMVINAIGLDTNRILLETIEGLALDQKGHVVVDENLQTSLSGVFAGGDVVLGAATVILAAGHGKQAAHAIDRYLFQK